MFRKRAQINKKQKVTESQTKLFFRDFLPDEPFGAYQTPTL